MNKTLRSYHLINRLLIIILFLFTSSVISSATIQVISSDELKYSNDSMDETGVPVGTVSTTGGTTAFSEDLLVYLTPFDNLTIYGKVNQGGGTVARVTNFRIYYTNFTLITPGNISSLTKTYPPITSDIYFSWDNFNFSLNSNLKVAKDTNFNLIAVDTIVSTNYSNQSLEAGNYWWKVRYYNSTAGTYGNYSDTFNFTIQSIQNVPNNSIQGTVYELVGGAVTPISGADVFIYNATYSTSQRTGANGYYLFQALSGTYNIYATKQGYDTTVALPVTASAISSVTNNILMKIYISPYVPNFVFERFIVRNLFDTPYPGVTVTVYKGDDLTASFTGMTDSIGQAVFQLIKDQKYRITLSGD